MGQESDWVKCGICCARNAQPLTLVGQQKVFVEELFHCISLPCSSFACDTCRIKLKNFKNYLREIFYNRVKLEKTHERMQEDSDETNEDEEKHTDSYTCKCVNCQRQYGSLRILAHVSEQQNLKTETATSSKPTNLPSEPQPSTSQDYKNKRKIMGCSYCTKTFTHKGDLNKHLRRHTGEQPFSCTICDRKFAHNSNLVRHIRLHSGDKPYTCDICNKSFSRRDKLDLHKKSKHK